MKKYHRYKMDFSNRNLFFSAVFAGVALFILVLHYLAFRYFGDTSMTELTIFLWIPAVLIIGYLVLLRIVRLNAPGVYAIVGTMLCILLLVWEIMGGNILAMVLFGLMYILASTVMILACGGFLPGRFPASVVFAVVLALRLLLTEFDAIGIARLAILAAVMLLPMGMIPGKEKTKGAA